MDWERFGIYVFSAFYGYACLTAPYKGRKWVNRLTVFIILLLLMWLPACDDTRTITETEYVDRDVIVTEPYYTRTVYDENMGEFTAEQQDELRTKGYLDMRLFYGNRDGLMYASTVDSVDAILNPTFTNGMVNFTSSGESFAAGKIGDCMSATSAVWTFEAHAAGACSFWVYCASSPGAHLVLLRTPFSNMFAGRDSAVLRVFGYSMNITTTLDAWHHIYIYWDSSSQKIYLDGSLIVTETILATGVTTSTLTVTNAKIDAIQMFGLPFDFHTELYNSGSGTETPIYR